MPDKPDPNNRSPDKPNVVLVLVDDMGFADLGITGSEINTPNIDNLARNGALLTSMYNCARCCPTRASLLTGLYPHNAGVGHMGANLGTPAYQGFLRNDSATIAEVLRESGYRTLMSGKWHVAGDFDAREIDSWRIGDVDHPTPRQRGFDNFYGIVDGATSFFNPHYMLEDDSRVEVAPNEFYFTDSITDKAITMIEDAVEDQQPFFLYLAHAAPHWPLHAPAEDIARYDGVYNKGWDAIRTSRHEEMNGRRILQANWPNGIDQSTVAHAPCHVVDILPTILAATGCTYVSDIGGHAIQPLQGESFLDLICGKEWEREQPIYFEHEGNSAIRLANFKLVRKHGQAWELYDMEQDRTELVNLAGKKAPFERQMLDQYNDWASKTGVLDWDVALPLLLKAWKLESVDG